MGGSISLLRLLGLCEFLGKAGHEIHDDGGGHTSIRDYWVQGQSRLRSLTPVFSVSLQMPCLDTVPTPLKGTVATPCLQLKKPGKEGGEQNSTERAAGHISYGSL